jgi:hypothetical protein
VNDAAAWLALAGTGVWIVGLSTVLATASYCEWTSKITHRTRRESYAQPSCRMSLAFGMCLIGVGLLARADSYWRQALWSALTVVFAWDAYRAYSVSRQPVTAPQFPRGQ